MMPAAIQLLINFYGTAFAYCALAVGLLWLIQRAGWLRDGAIAESAWRGALWFGLAVAMVSALRAPIADLWWALQPLPANADIAPAALPKLSSRADWIAVTNRAASASAAPDNVLLDMTVPSPADQQSVITSLDRSSAQWLAALLAAACMLAMAALLRSIWSSQRMLRLARRKARAAHPVWLHHRDQLAAHAGHVDIVSVAALDSPIAADGKLILLPEWCDQLPADAQRALLAHELAHIERHDPTWRLCDAIAVALMAGFPPARYAQLRLHDLSEFACDAEAARRSGAPRALAECLAQCLARALNHTPVLAVAMATPARGIVARVHRLLEEQPMFWNTWTQRTRRIGIAMVAAIALILPGIAISIAAEPDDDSAVSIRSSTSLFGNNSLSASYSDGDSKLKVEIEGKAQFNDAETDVVSISDGGELSIYDERSGVTHDLRVQPDGQGFKRRYRVDGNEVAFDAAGQKWLSSVLPQLFRSTGMDADGRLRRILAGGGVAAALNEISLIPSDYVRATYIGGLFKSASLDAAQLDRVIELTASIESDYELRRALTPALKMGVASETTQTRVLVMAASMDSDYERAELLIDAGGQFPLDGARLPAWQKATQTIGSDYEKRRVLEALLGQKEQHPEHAALAIAMAAGIDSDYEKRMLLQAAARMDVLDAAQYARVARGISSDYERREALLLLLAKGAVNSEVAMIVIEAARAMGSDYEAKELLLALAKVMPPDPQLIEAYRGVARDMAPYERGETEAGLDRFVST